MWSDCLLDLGTDFLVGDVMKTSNKLNSHEGVKLNGC